MTPASTIRPATTTTSPGTSRSRWSGRRSSPPLGPDRRDSSGVDRGTGDRRWHRSAACPLRTERDSYTSRARSAVRHRRAPVPPVRHRRAPVPCRATTGPKPRPVLRRRTKAATIGFEIGRQRESRRPRAGLGLDCGAQTGLGERENRQLHDSDRHERAGLLEGVSGAKSDLGRPRARQFVLLRTTQCRGALSAPCSAYFGCSIEFLVDRFPDCSPVSFAHASTRDSSESRSVGNCSTAAT